MALPRPARFSIVDGCDSSGDYATRNAIRPVLRRFTRPGACMVNDARLRDHPGASRRWIAACAALCVLPLLTASCGGPGKRAASVLVVTIDTLRPDHLGAYGHPGARTPHLDALARRGLQFTRARTPYPLTLPSHASIFTGLYPRSHGARRNDSFNLTREAPTLATILKSLGYETGAVVATFVLNSNFGLARGFDRYDDHWGMRGAG
ncbi:MAG: sulfatase-like hydrolase/transferase, partial [Gemmatimonadota bacterium]|nr:sulfatase-like hydrolase/transferase [Gemmatimonadota bacterium]